LRDETNTLFQEICFNGFVVGINITFNRYGGLSFKFQYTIYIKDKTFTVSEENIYNAIERYNAKYGEEAGGGTIGEDD